jgi:hypothetical protein
MSLTEDPSAKDLKILRWAGRESSRYPVTMASDINMILTPTVGSSRMRRCRAPADAGSAHAM